MRPPMWLGVGRFQGNGQNRTADFAGVVVSDRYVSYWHAGWENVAGHQACLAHLLRDYQDAAETYPGAHGDQRPGHVAGDRVVAVTNAFLPALRRSAHPRIVNISSGTGSLAWATGPQFPHRGTYAAYRSSKAALNALTVYYAHALADDGIKVNALAPGLRRTDPTPPPPPAMVTRPRPRRARSGWRCCQTTGPPASSSPGTGRRSPGRGGT